MSQLSSRVNLTSLLHESWRTINKNLALTCGLSFVYWLGVLILAKTAVFVLLEFPLSAGYLICLLKIGKGEAITAKEFFYGFGELGRFFNFILAGLLKIFVLVLSIGLPVALGILGVILVNSWPLRIGLGLLLFIPGFYVGIGTCLMLPIMVAKEKNFFEAFTDSLALVSERWGWYLRLSLFVLCLHILGLACFAVGTLVTTPLSLLMFYYAYTSEAEILQTRIETAVVSTAQIQVNPPPHPTAE